VSKVIGRSLEYLKKIFQSPSSFTARQPRVLDPIILTQEAMHGCYHIIKATGGALGLRYIQTIGNNSDERIEAWTTISQFRIAPDHVRYVLAFAAWHDDTTARRLMIHMADIDGNFEVTIASREGSRTNERIHIPTGFPIPGVDTNEPTSRGYTLVAQVSGNMISAGNLEMTGYYVDVWRGDLPPFSAGGGGNLGGS